MKKTNALLSGVKWLVILAKNELSQLFYVRFSNLLAACCSNLSTNQTFIIDCRVTPIRLAALSRESITQEGKSTLILF
jgi:hypothetical protein